MFFIRLLLKLEIDMIGKSLSLLSSISIVFLVQMMLSSGCPPLMVEIGVFGLLTKQIPEKGYSSLLMSKKYLKCFCS